MNAFLVFLRVMIAGDQGYLNVWAPPHFVCEGYCEPSPTLSVLVADDRVVVGITRVSHFDTVVIERRPWMPVLALGQLEGTLRCIHAAYLPDRTRIEIAFHSSGRHPLTYQDMIDVLSLAGRAGFPDALLMDADDLTAVPWPAPTAVSSPTCPH